MFMALGYRMASFDFNQLGVITKQFAHHVDIKNNNEIEFEQGLFLGSDESFLEYYSDYPDADERRQDVKLTYEYDKSDLTQGDGSPDQELVVSKARLVKAEFADEDMQVEWGHLLDPSATLERRERMQRNEVDLGGSLGYVIRAQDSKMDYLLDCDFCYRHSGFGVYESGCKKVRNNLEEGETPSNVHERLLEMALCHAVTMAITSGQPKKVMLYTVRQGQLHEADNAGEFFYKGEPKKAGRILFEVDPDGHVSVPSKKKALEVTPELSL
jgi:hypothetical protein